MNLNIQNNEFINILGTKMLIGDLINNINMN